MLDGGERPYAEPVVGRDHNMPAQGYRLTIRSDRIALVAADAAGEFYGRVTLGQLGSDGMMLPTGNVEDWPDLPVRGVMLDVSRDKVPTLETLYALVDRLAALKVNQLQLYMEHTFAYTGHEEVWRDASPFTGSEIAALDAFCSDRHVELVPNQNCLGHFERWLRHDAYRPLAIAPDGFERFGRRFPPTTIEPTNPRSLDLARDLLGQLVDHFSSRRVHVGLDEPWELPDERLGDYLAYMAAVRAVPELDGREMLAWDDIVALHPDQLDRIPAGVTLCDWGYEAGWPFDQRCSALAAAGLPFWVCPGTSSWNSLVGRSTNALRNVAEAAEAGSRHGASGLLMTDWGDNGHLQYLPVSEPLFAWAAALSWCSESNGDLDLATAVDRHVFRDRAGGFTRALLDLGDAHTELVPQVANRSVLCMHLYSPTFRMGEGLTEGMTAEDLERARDVVLDASERVAAARLDRDDADLVQAEIANSAALLDLLIRDALARLRAGGRLDGVEAQQRSRFATELEPIAARHRELWLERNRPGGLDDSITRLERLRRAYLGIG